MLLNNSPSGLRVLLTLLTAVLMMLFVSCQPKKPPESPIEWNFESDAILIDYDASADLNQYNDSPHTLILLVYQLSDAADFKSYIRTADGIKRLLNLYDRDQRKTISLEDLNDLQSFVINPGSEKQLKIDRLENTEWVGLVAGYYNAMPEMSSAVYPIPVKKTKEGFIRKKINTRPAKLNININFGANAMHTTRD